MGNCRTRDESLTHHIRSRVLDISLGRPLGQGKILLTLKYQSGTAPCKGFFFPMVMIRSSLSMFQVTNQEAVDAVRTLLTGSDKPNEFLAAKELAQLSARRGSADDITVLVVKLDQFIPQVQA